MTQARRASDSDRLGIHVFWATFRALLPMPAHGPQIFYWRTVMPHSYPRSGRVVPARRRLLLPALLLSCAFALAYSPFGPAGAQNDTDKQDASTTPPAAAVPGSGLDGVDAPRRKLTPPEGFASEPEAAAAPSKLGETVTAEAA